MAVTDIKSLTFGDNTFNLKDPTKYIKPGGGIPQTDLEQTVQNKLDKTVVVSDTQPTEAENKLWVDTDAGSGTTYQVPTVAEMQAADNSILGNLAMIESSPATQAHAVGEYIVYNGQLYKVTAAIAQGESLVSGTNVEATDICNAVGAYESEVLATYAYGTVTIAYNNVTKVCFLSLTGNSNATPSSQMVLAYLPNNVQPLIGALAKGHGGCSFIDVRTNGSYNMGFDGNPYASCTVVFPIK